MLGRPVTCWMFLSLLLGGNGITRAAEGDAKLAIARAALRDYYTSIQSLRSDGVWNQSLTDEGRSILPRTDVIDQIQWLWVEQGNQFLLEADGFYGTEMPPASFREYFDGISLWSGQEFSEHHGQWAPSTFSRKKGTPSSRELHSLARFRVPCKLTGLILARSTESLADRFDDPQARFVGETTVAGAVCWEFDLGEYQSDHGEAVGLTVCLDPQHAFLPRSLAYTCSNPRASERITTTEFFKIVDHATGGTRWFPREALVSTVMAEDTARITSAEVNLNLGPADFQPPLPDGTLIRDLPAQPGGATRETIVGGPEARRDIMEQQLAEAKLALPNPADLQNLPRVDASQRPAWDIADILFYLCVGILILVVTVRVYQRSPQPR